MRSRIIFSLPAVLLSTVLPLAGAGCHSLAPGCVTKGEPIELVVVAPAAWRSPLQRYLDYRSSTMRVAFAALEDILRGEPGADDAEKLKRYLFDLHSLRGLRYALLAGDADVLPVRYMCLDRVTKEAFDYAFYPSDLYYADLVNGSGSFEDWNGQRSGFHATYYGEVRGEKNKTDPINYDAVHYTADIGVGRWPVSNEAELERVISKTIQYERSASAPAARRALFVTVGGWVDCRNWIRNLQNWLPAHWSSVALFDGTTAPSESNVVAELQRGAGLVIHAGHGHDNGWEGSLHTGSIAKMNNAAALPIVLSAGCSTARFATLPPYEPYIDLEGCAHRGTNQGEVFTSPPPAPSCYARGEYNKTGFGEQLLKGGDNGAVAYFGCNTGSQPAGLTLVEGFIDKLKSAQPGRELRLGDLYQHAIAYYVEHQHLRELKPNDDWYPPSIFFQGMKFMLFGDPSLRIPND